MAAEKVSGDSVVGSLLRRAGRVGWRYCAACAGDLTDPGTMGAAGTSAVSVRLYDLPPDVRPLSAGDQGRFPL